MSVESSEASVVGTEDGLTTDTEPAPVPETSEETSEETFATPVEAPPETDTAAPQDDAPDLALVSSAPEAVVSNWPFVGYVGAWALFAGLVVWRLLAVPAGQPVFESGDYALSVGLGLTLTFAGPLTILVVWLFTPRPAGARRGPVLYSALMKGSLAMLAGVCLWWAALIIVDQIRLGRIL